MVMRECIELCMVLLALCKVRLSSSRKRRHVHRTPHGRDAPWSQRKSTAFPYASKMA